MKLRNALRAVQISVRLPQVKANNANVGKQLLLNFQLSLLCLPSIRLRVMILHIMQKDASSRLVAHDVIVRC